MTNIIEVAAILEKLDKNSAWADSTSLTPSEALIVIKIINKYFERVL